MKSHRTTTLGLLTAMLVFGGAVVACAGSEDPAAQDIQPTEPAAATATPLPPSKPVEAPPKVCISSCQNDGQCASSCPETAGAVGCCDTRTGTCFANKGATCPPPPADDDAGTPAY